MPPEKKIIFLRGQRKCLIENQRSVKMWLKEMTRRKRMVAKVVLDSVWGDPWEHQMSFILGSPSTRALLLPSFEFKKTNNVEIFC